ncbi:MAG: polysaccharide deacetylase family protein [Planctomycetaceae bacterium]
MFLSRPIAITFDSSSPLVSAEISDWAIASSRLRGFRMLSLFTIMRRKPAFVGLARGEVTLTFDDGPNMEDNVTPRLLDVLHQHRVKAGFCLVGNQIRRHPEIVRRMFQSGHLLINHTQNHVHPIRQKYPEMLADVEACDREIGRVLHIGGYRSQFFRAPYGIVTRAVRKVTRTLNLTPVLLTHYAWDTRVGPHNFQSVVDRTLQNALQHQGGMYVLHDGSLTTLQQHDTDWQRSTENRSWVPDAVDTLIRELKAHSLRFVVPGESQQETPAAQQRAAS